jgi:hypothetical protein
MSNNLNEEAVALFNEPTPKERVQFRVGFKNRTQTKACMLAYVDARYVMDKLDHCVGKENWEAAYCMVGNSMFCTIKVTWPDGKVTEKSDCGMETEVDAEKGQASDSFKRAAVHYGIGRDLYNLPQHWADCKDGFVKRDWIPQGWDKPEKASGDVSAMTPTSTSPASQPLPNGDKIEEVTEKLMQHAERDTSEAENNPVEDVSTKKPDNTQLKKGTPPEGEFVKISKLKRVAESAKAVLYLPENFTGDDKEFSETKPYWVAKSHIGSEKQMMNGLFEVEMVKWSAEIALSDGDTRFKQEDDLPF